MINDFVLCYKGVPDAWRVKPEDLAAAAAVGEPSPMQHIADDIRAGIFPRKSERLDAATIERCAQALNNVPATDGGMIYKQQAAAAIRALKDK